VENGDVVHPLHLCRNCVLCIAWGRRRGIRDVRLPEGEADGREEACGEAGDG
jgi:hypothetical protein